MKKVNEKRIYISDADLSGYGDVKSFIGTCLAKSCAKDEVILMCFRGDEHNAVAKKYAAENGLKVEFLPELTEKCKFAENCDLLLLIRGEDDQEINELISYALMHKIPFYVRTA